MLKPLRIRLTLVFSCLSGLILLLALAITYGMSVQQYRESQEALFMQTFSSVREELNKSGNISDTWLAQQERSGSILIWISDNGIPFHFSGIWQPPTDRDELASLAQEQAVQAGLSGMVDGFRSDLTVRGTQGEVYSGAVAYLGCPHPLCLVMLLAKAPQTIHLLKLAGIYISIALIGLCALAAVSWLLAGLALRPTAEALRRQTEFVAAASHELRSPLTVIKASLSAALVDKNHIQTSFLETARDESDRMARLIDDLLMLAGSDAGTWSIRREEVELDTFCIELYERFHLICQNQGHLLTLDLPDAPLPHVTLDQERITQLIGILISNACSYTPSSTPIEICVRSQQSYVELAVQDHGLGISDEEKEKVFRRFYRTDASRTDKRHFGLGLAVAAELAELHDATLIIRDTPSGGATFVLQLPL